MTNELQKQNEAEWAAIEGVLVQGDLSKLSFQQRVIYYNKTCESMGLNPLTKPFDYITLNGKMTLYARKDATEQLRSLKGISIYKMEKERTEDGVYVVTAYARDSKGREDTSIGAITIGGLKGDALANAYMKAETKAKRRVTLSLSGLGLLDESEIESIKGVVYEDDSNKKPVIQKSHESISHMPYERTIERNALKPDTEEPSCWTAIMPEDALEVASPEKVMELESLFKLYDVSQVIIDRGIKKAGFQELYELSPEDVDKWMDYLKVKHAKDEKVIAREILTNTDVEM